jgi:hypothetical protein
MADDGWGGGLDGWTATPARNGGGAAHLRTALARAQAVRQAGLTTSPAHRDGASPLAPGPAGAVDGAFSARAPALAGGAPRKHAPATRSATDDADAVNVDSPAVPVWLSRRDVVNAAALTVLAFVARFYRLDKPAGGETLLANAREGEVAPHSCAVVCRHRMRLRRLFGSVRPPCLCTACTGRR